jgi:hypothetical protein
VFHGQGDWRNDLLNLDHMRIEDINKSCQRGHQHHS